MHVPLFLQFDMAVRAAIEAEDPCQFFTSDEAISLEIGWIANRAEAWLDHHHMDARAPAAQLPGDGRGGRRRRAGAR